MLLEFRDKLKPHEKVTFSRIRVPAGCSLCRKLLDQFACVIHSNLHISCKPETREFFQESRLTASAHAASIRVPGVSR